jgi:hypothetical protein
MKNKGEEEIINLLKKIYTRAGWILFWVIIILIGLFFSLD